MGVRVRAGRQPRAELGPGRGDAGGGPQPRAPRRGHAAAGVARPDLRQRHRRARLRRHHADAL